MSPDITETLWMYVRIDKERATPPPAINERSMRCRMSSDRDDAELFLSLSMVIDEEDVSAISRARRV